MKFSTALTALTFIPSALAMTRAGVKKAVESRRLSFEPIGLNYEPGSQVTDHVSFYIFMIILLLWMIGIIYQ